MSLIKKLTGIAYNGGQTLRRDKIINVGTQFLFDFANSYCSPLTGTLAAGATIANLVDSAPVATAAGAGAATFGTKGLTFDGAGALRLDLGTTYSLTSADSDFLLIFWISGPATRNTADQGVFGNSYNSSDCEFLVRQNGANALIMYADGHQAYWTGGTSNDTLPTSTAFGPTQYGMAWIKTTGGANIETYKNGTRLGGGAAQQSGGATPWKGTIHRALKENLTLSGAIASQQVALDYARNLARFT